MKNEIIELSIESLQTEGLKFSVDTLAERLKISKKTIYKYFSTKEELALAVYEKYYATALSQAKHICQEANADTCKKLFRLYYGSKKMIRNEIFNKYNLNQVIYAYAVEQHTLLWATIADFLFSSSSSEETEIFRVILDGTFEKLCTAQANAHMVEAVTERLVNWIC